MPTHVSGISERYGTLASHINFPQLPFAVFFVRVREMFVVKLFKQLLEHGIGRRNVTVRCRDVEMDPWQ